MPLPSTWQTATGEGSLLFDTFYTISNVLLYLPNDTPNSRFTSDTSPLRIRFAGGVGFGLDPSVGVGIDPLPTGVTATQEVFYWHWLEFQYEVWQTANLSNNGGSAFFWKLAPGITLNYFFNA